MKSINKTRSLLYWLARILGDINAVVRCFETGSPMPLVRRVAHKAAGRKYGSTVGKFINKM